MHLPATVRIALLAPVDQTGPCNVSPPRSLIRVNLLDRQPFQRIYGPDPHLFTLWTFSTAAHGVGRASWADAQSPSRLR